MDGRNGVVEGSVGEEEGEEQKRARGEAGKLPTDMGQGEEGGGGAEGGGGEKETGEAEEGEAAGEEILDEDRRCTGSEKGKTSLEQ